MICEIGGLFINTLTADDKDSLRYRENLPQPIQMQVSKKGETCSYFFPLFLQFSSNFEHFESKGDLQSLCVSEIRIWERRG